MNIQQLIKDKCPNGVKYELLKDVCDMKRGQSYTSKDLTEGEYPVVAGGKKPAMYASIYNRDGETITVSSSGAYAGYVQYRNSPILCTDSFTCKTDGCKLLCKYLFYVLTSLQDKIYLTKKGGGIPHVHISDLENFEIPILPLEIQTEIVKVLDRLTELKDGLESELQIELDARKKQYEYYRNKLLSFGNEVKWTTVKEICSVERGKVYSKVYLSEHPGDYPVYSSQTANNGELGRIDTYNYEGEYLTRTTDGVYAGTIFRRNGKFSVTNVCGLLALKDNTDIKLSFLYYRLSVEAKKHVSEGMGNPKLMSNVMEKIPVPIPSLSEQERIVNILERFSALSKDIIELLPTEIEMRQKQYEYYRDRLLTFNEA